MHGATNTTHFSIMGADVSAEKRPLIGSSIDAGQIQGMPAHWAQAYKAHKENLHIVQDFSYF